MLIVASAFAAVIPMSVYLVLIWRFDRYDREPFGMVLLNYLLGGVGAILFAVAGSGIFSIAVAFFISDPGTLSIIEAVLIAPFVEEITKALFVLIIFMNKKFDNITDGIVYGGAVGLGFGMTENFLYFISFGSTFTGWITMVLIRTMFSAVMHCISTATFGAFLGYAKFKEYPLKIILPLIGLSVAMFIHFAWNFSVSFESTTLAGFVFMFFTIAVFIAVFSTSVYSEKKIIYTELLEEVTNGIIPAEHLNILNSPRRNNNGWVDEEIRRVYISAATTLAFRKKQYRSSAGSSRFYYEQDINHYRTFISNILHNSKAE
jgi:RsiW-degrading membrane proteinase PrsW (M82 family)